MKRQNRFYGSPLRHATNAVEEAGMNAARTPAIPQSQELYAALRAMSISLGSFSLSEEEQSVIGAKISGSKLREPVLKPKMFHKKK